MLREITWGHYWSVLITACAIYYFFIALFFFRKEIAALLQRKIVHHPSGHKQGNRGHVQHKDRKEGFEGMELVVADIKEILQKTGRGADKDSIIEAITARVSGYVGLTQPVFRNALIQYTVRNAESICGVALSEEEMEAAWDGLPR